MKMQRTYLLATFIFFTLSKGYAHREQTHFLQGKLGQDIAIIRIDDFGEVGYLKYFLLKDKKDVVLKGSCDSTTCSFERQVWDEQKQTNVVVEQISLQNREGETWTCKWTMNGTSHNITLNPLTKDSFKHRYSGTNVLNEFDPYAYTRTADLEMDTIRIEKKGPFYFIWLREPMTKIDFFQLSGEGQSQLDPINNWLVGKHLETVENSFSCQTYGHEGKLDISTQVHYVRKDLISFSVSTKSNCYGKFIKKNTDHFTMDIQTGKRLELEEILWLSDSLPPRPRSASWYEYRRNIFGKYLLAELLRLYPNEMTSPADCPYNEEQPWQVPSWFLTDQGIYFGAMMPGIDKNCNAPDWSIIPFNRLLPNLSNKYEWGAAIHTN